MKLPRYFRIELSITARLMCWFLAISLIPCLLLTGLIEYISSDSLEKSMRSGLMVIAEAKAAAIDNFVRARRGDVTLAGHLQTVIGATSRLAEVLKTEQMDSPAYKKESAPYRKVLSYYKDAYGYSNAYLFALDGTLLFRLDDDLDIGTNLKQGAMKDSELADVFERSKMLLQSMFADFQPYPGHKEPLAFVANPVFDPRGVNIGIVVLQLGNREIYRVLNDLNGLGETGETGVGQLKGDEVTVVAPLRFDPEAAFRRKVRLGGAEMAGLQRAVQGQSGFGETLDYRGKKVVAVWSYIPALRWGLVVKQDASEAYAVTNRQRMAIGSLLATTLVLVVVVALIVARSLSRPIVAAVEVANRVAGGDLTAQIRVKAKGEVGKLLRAIQTMTLDLRTLIGKIQKSSISLMSTATQIAATARQQEQTVHDYGASTNEAAAAVKEISATSQELLRTMNEVNHVAGETAELASHGQESLAGMDKTMRLLADSTTSIGSKLSVISERAANINLVVTTITKVADQTNLLSINAAIEAEKAGEYGLGFLVVAREIRRLADQTAVSTLDIERMVKEMQYSVSAGVMEMDKFSDQVRQGVHEVAVISGQLAKIITAVHGLTVRFDQVTEGMTVQAQGAEQIRESVVHLSEGASQTLVSLREFNQATGQLREAVGGLKEEVSRFRVEPSST
jgi:methyl-accepting chemotaxis protein WspA